MRCRAEGPPIARSDYPVKGIFERLQQRDRTPPRNFTARMARIDSREARGFVFPREPRPGVPEPRAAHGAGWL
jgi:hypothetical protein